MLVSRCMTCVGRLLIPGCSLLVLCLLLLPGRENATDTIFKYLVDEATCNWHHWASCVPEWTYPRNEEKPKFSQLVIPTLDSVRCAATLPHQTCTAITDKTC
jgi:hypothetical protein